MEGTPCAHPGCNCRDFLPFECPKCGQDFCLDHRSRFVHGCGNTEAKVLLTAATENFSEAKSMIEAVESRLSSDCKGSDTDHFRIKTSTTGTTLVPQASAARIEKVGAIVKKSSNETTKRIGDKTKKILIRNHAIGNEHINVDDRLYLGIQFSTSSSKVFHFFKKSTPLGEILHYIATTQPQLSFGKASRPDGLSLVLHTEDSPDWHLWDRRVPISEMLDDFEDVFISAASTEEVIEAQRKIESTQLSQSVNMSTDEPSDSVATIASSSSLAIPEEPPFVVGEIVEYQCKLTDGSGKENLELVTVVGVHYDDFPNIYYTIRYNSSSREKQTDANRLRRIRPMPAVASSKSTGPSVCISPDKDVRTTTASSSTAINVEGAPLSLRITHGSNQFQITGIGEDNTVAQLKDALRAHTGVIPKFQKLVFKGATLKDGLTLKKLKIQNGSKVTMIGTVGGR